MSEEIVEEATTTTQRRGPAPNPFVRYKRAQAKAEKARRAYDKVQALAEAKASAEAEEAAALEALQSEFDNLGINEA